MQWILDAFPQLQHITPLTQGGQKMVFTASHPVEGDVVLKLISPFEPIEGVRREIIAVNQVNSQRVPRIIDAGTLVTPMSMGKPSVWFIEQRVSGITLRTQLDQGALSTDQILSLMLHTLEALEQAEKVSIVHRDVKPENIMIDKSGSYWLLDFGIARHLTMQTLTPAAWPYGKFTCGYAPVEQFRNIQKEIDSRADLYGLGVTVYECATGRHPFRFGASSDLEILKRVENGSVPLLNLKLKDSASFRDLLSSMTQKRRDNRPPSVAEALAWLRDIIKRETS